MVTMPSTKSVGSSGNGSGSQRSRFGVGSASGPFSSDDGIGS
jgi:hypothetical protein